MCGFGGVIDYKNKISYLKMSKIASKVSFRGPDNTSTHLYNEDFQKQSDFGHYAVFHNRLSIIDIDSRSNQPFENEHFLLLFNGEIYNFEKIKFELSLLGHKFKTSSDTEVLFNSLIEWKEKSIVKLNGIFSFIFINKKTKEIICSRDRLGVKPLFICVKDSALYFASELDSIIRMMPTKPSVNLSVCQLYLTLQYIPAPETIWNDIINIEPGTFISGKIDEIIKNNKTPRREIYWSPFGVNYELVATEENLETLLTNSLKLQLCSDAPIGMLLSSGIDSSLLAALIAINFPDNNLKYFTIAYDEKSKLDESEYARKFLLNLNVPAKNHIIVKLNSSDIAKKWKVIYDKVDQPFGDPAILLNTILSEVASEHVKVAISGDGADEIFNGYERYKLASTYSRISSYLNLPILSFINNFLDDRRLSILSCNNPVDQYLMLLDPNRYDQKKLEAIFANSTILQNKSQILSRLDVARSIDLKSYLPDGMLYKVDRSSMSTGLEVRVPYLDNYVVDFGLKNQSNHLSKILKHDLKELLNKVAPTYDTTRAKTGFSFPLIKWMRTEWKKLISELIFDSDLGHLAIFKEELIVKFYKFYEGDDSIGDTLWIHINLILWYQNKIKVMEEQN